MAKELSTIARKVLEFLREAYEEDPEWIPTYPDDISELANIDIEDVNKGLGELQDANKAMELADGSWVPT